MRDTPPDDATHRQHSTLSSVTSAARVLKEFARGPADIGVTEMSRRMSIGKSTAHRLMSTLADEGLLARDPDTGSYRLGLGMFELGALVPLPARLVVASAPVLDALADSTGQICHVAVLDGGDTVLVSRRTGRYAPRRDVTVALRLPASVSGAGKVLLAFLPSAELAATLPDLELRAATPYSVRRREALLAELATARSRGWAEDAHESDLGIASVAAPVRDENGAVVAAVAIVGPVGRLTGASLAHHCDTAVCAGRQISSRLGYAPARADRSGT
jgi:DNA-binding IclR family transcriptional regulator